MGFVFGAFRATWDLHVVQSLCRPPTLTSLTGYVRERPWVTPSRAGFLRITSARYQSTTRSLYGDGRLVVSSLFNNKDVELLAGVRYELRVTGSCDENPSPVVAMTLLRPEG